VATLIALGPGDPELIPLASWRALEAAGPVAIPIRLSARFLLCRKTVQKKSACIPKAINQPICDVTPAMAPFTASRVANMSE